MQICCFNKHVNFITSVTAYFTQYPVKTALRQLEWNTWNFFFKN